MPSRLRRARSPLRHFCSAKLIFSFLSFNAKRKKQRKGTFYDKIFWLCQKPEALTKNLPRLQIFFTLGLLYLG